MLATPPSRATYTRRSQSLRRDLEEYLRFYNFNRIHQGRLTAGQIPANIVYGAREMEPR